jgi:hypothetical protein
MTTTPQLNCRLHKCWAALDVRTLNYTWVCALLALAGCTHAPTLGTRGNPLATSLSQATLLNGVVESMAGTWLFQFNEGDKNNRIQLSSSGHWEWWVEEDGKSVETPFTSGTWFVYRGVLVLRVEKAQIGEIPPGSAFTWDIRQVTAKNIVIFDLLLKTEITWKRAAS